MALKEAAGTAALAAYYNEKIAALRARREDVSEIIDDTRIRDANSWRYYADWRIAAVHVALTIPGVRTEVQLSRLLNTDVTIVQGALGLLQSLRLVEKRRDGYHCSLSSTHLANTDPAIVLHHQTWRMKAMEQIKSDPRAGVHYSAIASVSAEDLRTLKTLLLETIRTFVDRVKLSPPEVMLVFSADLFRV